MAFSSHPKGRPQVTTTSTRLRCPAVLVKTKKKREGVTYASKVGTIYVPIHQVPIPKGVGWGAQSCLLIKPAVGHSHSWLIVIHGLLNDFPSKSVSYPYVYGRRFEDMK